MYRLFRRISDSVSSGVGRKIEKVWVWWAPSSASESTATSEATTTGDVTKPDADVPTTTPSLSTESTIGTKRLRDEDEDEGKDEDKEDVHEHDDTAADGQSDAKRARISDSGIDLCSDHDVEVDAEGGNSDVDADADADTSISNSAPSSPVKEVPSSSVHFDATVVDEDAEGEVDAEGEGEELEEEEEVTVRGSVNGDAPDTDSIPLKTKSGLEDTVIPSSDTEDEVLRVPNSKSSCSSKEEGPILSNTTNPPILVQ